MKNSLSRFSSTLALTAPALALLAANADAAIFIKFDGVDGESVDSRFEKHIEVLSWSWGMTQSGMSTAGGGGGAGKVSLQDFHFTSSVSKASPQLFLACATGQHIPEVTLHFTRRLPSGQDVPYYTITLSDVLVSSVSGGRDEGAAGNTTDRPTERVSLNFHKIKFEYTPIDDNGAAQAPVVAEAEVEQPAAGTP